MPRELYRTPGPVTLTASNPAGWTVEQGPAAQNSFFQFNALPLNPGETYRYTWKMQLAGGALFEMIGPVQYSPNGFIASVGNSGAVTFELVVEAA